MVMSVDGAKPHPLSELALQAVVGVARLHVPRSLQAVTLSCPVGRAVTRDVPLKNVGNIPLGMDLNVVGVAKDDPAHFSLTPTALHMEPGEVSLRR